MITGLNYLGPDSTTIPTMHRHYVDAGSVCGRKYQIINQNSILSLMISPDNGLTWARDIPLDTAVGQITLWFDRWTPGDTGTKIHIWWFETTSDDVFYTYYDVSSQAYRAGGIVTVFAGATALTGNNMALSGCKTRGGNLLVAFDIDQGVETGFYRSTDAGDTWASRTNVWEGSTDHTMLFPGNYADNQDVDAIFWDGSADAITLKTYDDSGNSWAEAFIASSMVDQGAATHPSQMAGILTPGGHILLAAWSAYDAAGSDLMVWDINGSGSITAKTNIITNTANVCAAEIQVRADGLIRVYYCGKSDGSQTVASNATQVSLCYVESTDGGTTWGSEVIAIAGPYGFQGISADPILPNNGAIFCQLQEMAISTTVKALWTAVTIQSPKASFMMGI